MTDRVRRSRRRIRRVVATAATVLLGTLLTGWVPGGAAAAQPAPNSVTVTVLQVTPTTPIATPTARAIKVVLRLTNTTTENLGTVTVEGSRGNPISNQAALDAAIARPQPPDSALVGRFTATTPVTAALPAGASTTVTYSSTTASSPAAAGLCLCEDRIYPLYFGVHQHLAGGEDVLVGSTQTFIPAFTAGSNPQQVRVSWVWPILDPPHRSFRDNVFTDDDLAKSVGAGGRLDRVLQVVEQVGATVPMTLLIDPDLIDELAVMAAGQYAVVTGGGRTQPGIGTAAAKSWLLRLRAALNADPGLELSFTPYADPDVDSLVRNGLTWSTSQNAAAQARVSAALGRDVPTDIAWPVNGSMSPDTLDALVAKGTRTVVVDDTTLPGGKHNSPPPDALASIPTPHGRAAAAVTSAAIEKFAAQVVTRGSSGLARLPELVSEVAIRAVEDGANAHYVVITPPREVDPVPSVAAAAIVQSARTIWSRPLPLRTAAATVTPVDHGKLSATARPNAGLPDETISTAQSVTASLPSLASMIPIAAQRTQLVGFLPEGIQRSESSAWIADPATGVVRARALRSKVSTVTDGVQLVKPTHGTYTLGSADSPLPITIDNTLDAQVKVRVQVSTVGGVPGLTADDVGIETIDPNSKLPLHVPLHIDRAGRFKVQVELMTPDGAALGTPLPLSVRSTALGDIGKIITFAAAAVLAGALLFRVLRRWRRHSNDGTAGELA